MIWLRLIAGIIVFSSLVLVGLVIAGFKVAGRFSVLERWYFEWQHGSDDIEGLVLLKARDYNQDLVKEVCCCCICLDKFTEKK